MCSKFLSCIINTFICAFTDSLIQTLRPINFSPKTALYVSLSFCYVFISINSKCDFCFLISFLIYSSFSSLFLISIISYSYLGFICY